jgi:hypothetical protein
VSEVNQNLGCLYQSLVCLGPIIAVFLIWQLIRLSGLEYWVRVPRQTAIRQWLQNSGVFLLSVIIALCVQFLILFLYGAFEANPSGTDLSNEQLENRFSLFVASMVYVMAMVVGTFVLFELVLSFMQSWIKPAWVKWVTETYPERYREILLYASRNEERKKWRQSKDFVAFQEWVKEFAQEQYGIESSAQRAS